MDCMNSEVSSENHPACGGGDSAVKWGGASSGYSGGYVTGDVVTHPGDRGLPYAMVPTQVPQQSGFAGYSAEGAAGFTGYAGPQSQYGHGQSGRNVNPIASCPEEPPPNYTEAMNHG